LSGFIADNLGWPFTFYAFGLAAILFSGLWHHFCYNDPADHPSITSVSSSQKFFGHPLSPHQP
jgi:hypothetical protein